MTNLHEASDLDVEKVVAPESSPDDTADVEPTRRQRCNTVPRGGGVARLLADVLASPITDDAPNVDGALMSPVPPAAKVEPVVTAPTDPLRRPVELATIAAGRLTMRLGELPRPNDGSRTGTYRVQVAVTTPDGARIEISTEVDGVDGGDD